MNWNREIIFDRKGKSAVALILLIVILMSCAIGVLIFQNKKKQQSNHIIEETKYYAIKIEKPTTKNPRVKKEINNMIKDSIKILKKDVRKDKKQLEKNNQKYELIIQNNTSEFNGTKTIHLTKFYFNGGNHYQREDKSYHYKSKTYEEVQLKDFFKDPSGYLNTVSELSFYKVMEWGEIHQKSLDPVMVKEGLEPKVSNFENYQFNETGLTILFPPTQVGSWADGEITISFPYHEIDEYLNFDTTKLVQKPKDVPGPIEPRDLSSITGKPLIAVTFDDGPSAHTTIRLLDELQKRNMKVSFFVLGNRVEEYPQIVRREYMEGHTVGSHTYNHLNLINLTDYDVYKEISSTNNAIYNAIGQEVKYIRPPYGNTNDNIKKIGNMTTVMWSVDTEDWKHRDAEYIKNKVKEKAHDGAVILLHDLYDTSIDGVLMAMDELHEQGYEFVSLDEMITLKNIQLDKMKSYYEF